MGKLMPIEKLVEEIKDHATQWLINPTEEEKQKLCSMCMLLLSKEATEGKNILEVSQQMERQKRIHERLENEKL